MVEKSKLFLIENGEIALRAIRCIACEYVDFPPQQHGCRRCGATGASLRESSIASEGTVLASATVHHFPGEKYAVPFTISSVVLDAGPMTRVVMKDVEPAAQGDKVVAVLQEGPGEPAEIRYVKETLSNA